MGKYHIIHEIGNFSRVLPKFGKKCMTALLQFFKWTINHCLVCQLQSFKHCISDVALVSKFQFCNLKLGYFFLWFRGKRYYFQLGMWPNFGYKTSKKIRNLSIRHRCPHFSTFVTEISDGWSCKWECNCWVFPLLFVTKKRVQIPKKQTEWTDFTITFCSLYPRNAFLFTRTEKGKYIFPVP